MKHFSDREFNELYLAWCNDSKQRVKSTQNVQTFKQILRRSSDRRLVLRSSRIGVNTSIAISRLFGSHLNTDNESKLEKIDLHENVIRDKGLLAIIELMEGENKVRVLNIGSNDIGPFGFGKFCEYLSERSQQFVNFFVKKKDELFSGDGKPAEPEYDPDNPYAHLEDSYQQQSLADEFESKFRKISPLRCLILGNEKDELYSNKIDSKMGTELFESLFYHQQLEILDLSNQEQLGKKNQKGFYVLSKLFSSSNLASVASKSKRDTDDKKSTNRGKLFGQNEERGKFVIRKDDDVFELKNTKIKSLRLGNCNFHNDSFNYFLRNVIDSERHKSTMDNYYTNNLFYLDVSDNHLTSEICLNLGRYLGSEFCNLSILNLQNNSLEYEGLKLLYENDGLLKNKTLTVLNLKNNKLGLSKKNKKIFQKSFSQQQLEDHQRKRGGRTAARRSYNFEASSGKIIELFLRSNNTLINLNLENNSFSKEECNFIFNSFYDNNTLQELNMNHNNQMDLKNFKSLKAQKSLRSLHLKNCNINDKNLILFLLNNFNSGSIDNLLTHYVVPNEQKKKSRRRDDGVVEYNFTMKKLNFFNNHLTSDSGKIIYQILKQNCQITFFKLKGNQMEHRMILKINNLLKKNILNQKKNNSFSSMISSSNFMDTTDPNSSGTGMLEDDDERVKEFYRNKIKTISNSSSKLIKLKYANTLLKKSTKHYNDLQNRKEELQKKILDQQDMNKNLTKKFDQMTTEKKMEIEKEKKNIEEKKKKIQNLKMKMAKNKELFENSLLLKKIQLESLSGKKAEKEERIKDIKNKIKKYASPKIPGSGDEDEDDSSASQASSLNVLLPGFGGGADAPSEEEEYSRLKTITEKKNKLKSLLQKKNELKESLLQKKNMIINQKKVNNQLIEKWGNKKFTILSLFNNKLEEKQMEDKKNKLIEEQKKLIEQQKKIDELENQKNIKKQKENREKELIQKIDNLKLELVDFE